MAIINFYRISNIKAISSIGMGGSEPVNQTLICLKWRHLATLSGLRERDLCTFGNTLLYI